MIISINEFKKVLESNEDEIIRISCAALASIKINDKYLLLLNNSSLKRGEKIYTPLGGALEFTNTEFLDTLNAQFEKGKDLRFTTSKSNIPAFEDWFKSMKDREIGIDRELKEELVDETKMFKSLLSSDYTSTYITLDKSVGYYNGINNYRYFEIFRVIFNHNKVQELFNVLDNSDTMYLATYEEIKNEITDTGIKIGNNALPIAI